MKTHKFGRKKFKCDECGKEFNVRLTYKAHMKDHTVDGNILCDECGESFKTKYDMKSHRESRHKPTYRPASKIGKIKNNEDIVCSDCGEQFSNNIRYDYHKESRHSGLKFVCDICSREFSTNKIFKRHLQSHSSPTLPCGECGKLFLTPSYLRLHTRNIHTDPKYRIMESF